MVMSCSLIIRSAFLSVKSPQNKVWSSIILRLWFHNFFLLLSRCSFEKEWYLVTVLQRKNSIKFHPFFSSQGSLFLCFSWEIIHGSRLNPRVGKFSEVGFFCCGLAAILMNACQSLLGHVCQGLVWNAALVAPCPGNSSWLCSWQACGH